jgi:hypothetical protein
MEREAYEAPALMPRPLLAFASSISQLLANRPCLVCLKLPVHCQTPYQIHVLRRAVQLDRQLYLFAARVRGLTVVLQSHAVECLHLHEYVTVSKVQFHEFHESFLKFSQ